MTKMDLPPPPHPLSFHPFHLCAPRFPSLMSSTCFTPSHCSPLYKGEQIPEITLHSKKAQWATLHPRGAKRGGGISVRCAGGELTSATSANHKLWASALSTHT